MELNVGVGHEHSSPGGISVAEGGGRDSNAPGGSMSLSSHPTNSTVLNVILCILYNLLLHLYYFV